MNSEAGAVLLSRLFEENHAWLVARIRRKFQVRDAEDLVQDLWRKVARRLQLDGINQEDMLQPAGRRYLEKAADRLALDLLRKRRRTREVQGVDHQARESDKGISRQDIWDTLERCLTSEQLMIMRLRVEQCSREEIAEQLGMSVSQVDKRWARVRTIARKALHAEGWLPV